VLELLGRETAVQPLTLALAFVALLFGVVGRELPGALLARRHLSAVGWPADAEGWRLWRAASRRLAALALSFLGSSLLLAFVVAR
jgi:hypothetical protein